MTRRQLRERSRQLARSSEEKPLKEPEAVTGAQRTLGAALGRPRPHGKLLIAFAILIAIAILLLPLFLSLDKQIKTKAAPPTASAPLASISGDSPLSSALQVTGRIGSVPVLSLKGRLGAPTTVHSDVVIQGTGRTVNSGEGIVLSISTFTGIDGSNTTQSSTGIRLYRGYLTSQELGEEITDAITEMPEGSRVVLRAPVKADAGEMTTEITVVDLLPSCAQGETLPAGADVPVVAMAADGTVSVSTADLPEPTRGSATVLIQGEGTQVAENDKIIARYTIVSWDGAVRSSSYGWAAVPGIIDMSDTLSGLAQRLLDVQVGSRVVVSLPADQARGDAAMVVVVDLLAIAHDEAAQSAQPTSSPSMDVVHVTPSAQATPE